MKYPMKNLLKKNKYLSNTDIKNYMTKFNKLEKEKEE